MVLQPAVGDGKQKPQDAADAAADAVGKQQLPAAAAAAAAADAAHLQECPGTAAAAVGKELPAAGAAVDLGKEDAAAAHLQLPGAAALAAGAVGKDLLLLAGLAAAAAAAAAVAKPIPLAAPSMMLQLAAPGAAVATPGKVGVVRALFLPAAAPSTPAARAAAVANLGKVGAVRALFLPGAAPAAAPAAGDLHWHHHGDAAKPKCCPVGTVAAAAAASAALCPAPRLAQKRQRLGSIVMPSAAAAAVAGVAGLVVGAVVAAGEEMPSKPSKAMAPPMRMQTQSGGHAPLRAVQRQHC